MVAISRHLGCQNSSLKVTAWSYEDVQTAGVVVGIQGKICSWPACVKCGLPVGCSTGIFSLGFISQELAHIHAGTSSPDCIDTVDIK